MDIWQADRATVQFWVSLAALLILLLVAPTLAWLLHAFLTFRSRVDAKLDTLTSPPPAQEVVVVPRRGSPPPQLGPELPDYFGAEAPRGSTPMPPAPRQTRLPPRRG